MSDHIENFLHREELKLASIQKRALAFFIDAFILVVMVYIIYFDAISALDPLDEEAILYMQLEILKTYIPLTFIYQWVFTALYGASIGKIAMKIKIIDIKTGDIPSWGVALNRAGVRIISEYLLNLGFLWGVLDPYKQTWHDKSAQTLVIDA